jgi:hypothetical protein
MSRKEPKKPIFTKEFWDRPAPPREQGDSDGPQICMSVGHALTNWETADQALAGLILVFAEATTGTTYNVIRRVYGSIESNSGRRAAVEAAAEVYFGSDYALARPSLMDVINAVQWASKRRDDIAHGVVQGVKIDNRDYGHFLFPPEYNTGRTHLYSEPSADPLQLIPSKYRFVDTEVSMFSQKFADLRNAIIAFQISVVKVDGVIPLVKNAKERGGKPE